MAIDGTKIIDSDLASDIEGEFISLYDAGESTDSIKEKLNRFRSDITDDFEDEIFITTYALCLWKICALTDDVLDELKVIVAKGAGVKMWLKESGEVDARKREKNLHDLVHKISVQRKSPIKRNRHKTEKELILQVNDVVTFLCPDGLYRAAIMAKIVQHKGCTYLFASTNIAIQSIPTLEHVLNSQIFGRKIQSSFSRSVLRKRQPGIDVFWDESKTKSSFFIGLNYIMVGHTELKLFKNNLIILGKIPILESFKEGALYGGARNFEQFAHDIVDYKRKIKIPIFDIDLIDVKMLVLQEQSLVQKLNKLFKL
jgi:hypothetical protein